jgi:holo-ACP synthase
MNAMADASCSPVSLAQLLASRDPCSATAALVNVLGADAHFDDPGLAGDVKDTPVSRAVMGVANEALFGLILANGWEIIRHDARQLITGPESFWSVNAPRFAGQKGHRSP